MPTYRLGWYDNADRLDVAVLVNRLVACGTAVSRVDQATGSDSGDYIVDLSSGLAEELRGRGFTLTAAGGGRQHGQPIKPVRAVVLAGKASAYPYYGYYALALSRLGIAYRPVSGAEIAAGALDGENILVLPGGFSNWSLDAKEETRGADQAVRAFFRDGGAAVASCGGAYYLAKGRSTWLGLADARPNITQDYLRTGVGITTCRIADGPLRRGLPPTLEIPYFHGPAFDEIGGDCRALGHFRDLVSSGRLFIDNPLTAETFAAHMRDRIAILAAEGPRGRAILFSPHPEMGDLLSKYMLLESYVPHYLPIRGPVVMRETLTAAHPEEFPLVPAHPQRDGTDGIRCAAGHRRRNAARGRAGQRGCRQARRPGASHGAPGRNCWTHPMGGSGTSSASFSRASSAGCRPASNACRPCSTGLPPPLTMARASPRPSPRSPTTRFCPGKGR